MKTGRLGGLTIALLCASFFYCVPGCSGEAWREAKSDHFVVYFLDSDVFARGLLGEAENFYLRIASDIGYGRYTDFWSWEKRAKIYIYPDQPSYIKATKKPEWTRGFANLKGRQIVSYEESAFFTEEVLPHEMAHLIFRDFVGQGRGVPFWIDEGIAQWEGSVDRSKISAIAKTFYDNDLLFALSDLTQLDIYKIGDIDQLFIRSMRTREGKETVGFLSTKALISAFYAQSASLVGFMIKRYGSDDFAYFCRELSYGKSIDDALRSAYPYYFQSLDDLETRWRDHLGKL